MSKQKSDDSRMSRGKRLVASAALALPAIASLAVALAFAGGCSKDSTTDHMKPMSGDEHQKMQTR